MEALAPNIVIKRIPRPRIVYGSNMVQEFNFPPCSNYGFAEPWLTLDLLVFSVPLETRCSLNGIVAASGTYVATATPEPSVAATNAAMAELRAVVSVIQEGRPLQPNNELDELLTRALEMHGTPRNVEGWAHQLATDTGELTD